MKKQFYVFACLIAMANNAFTFNERVFFDETNTESQWKFIEKKFITDINDTKKSFWKHITAMIPAMIAAGCGYQLYNFEYNNLDPKEAITKTALEPKNFITILGLGASGVLINQMLGCYLTHQINRDAVVDFFENWDENQFYVPKALYEAFTMIADMLNETDGQQTIVRHADEIVEITQFMVKRHFEKRYEKSLQIEAYNALADAKTTVEFFKNSIEAAAKLSGAK